MKTVEALKREQIGNICLFADLEGGVTQIQCTSCFLIYFFGKVEHLSALYGRDRRAQAVLSVLQLWASMSNWDLSVIRMASGASLFL